MAEGQDMEVEETIPTKPQQKTTFEVPWYKYLYFKNIIRNSFNMKWLH
jgi:hypothetical protein